VIILKTHWELIDRKKGRASEHAVLGDVRALLSRAPDYRDQIQPESVTARVSVEEGSILGWAQYVGRRGHSIGMETFGASAPIKELQKKFSFTPENIIAAAKR
jgi:transketolase